MNVGNNVIWLKVVGSAVESPFLLAMIGVFGGLAELTLVGLFVGTVIMAALLLVWRQWFTSNTERLSHAIGSGGAAKVDLNRASGSNLTIIPDAVPVAAKSVNG